MTGDDNDVFWEKLLVPPRGEKNFKPHPQSRILVPLRGSF